MKNFGKQARDKVSGFTGIVTSKHIYMYGCTQYGLDPGVNKDGKLQRKEFFDEGRLEVFEEVVNPDSVKAEKNGCDYRERP